VYICEANLLKKSLLIEQLSREKCTTLLLKTAFLAMENHEPYLLVILEQLISA